jgi:diguanylate cyclase (GGDEF)-like protein/PAS domain S-box-containing protein
MVEANPAMEEMLGYSAAELAEMDMQRYTHPEDVGCNLALFKELMAGDRDSFQLEKRCYRKDGALIWVQVTAALERDAQGKPKFAISMLENITERKVAGEALLRQEERLSALILHSADAIFTIDKDRRISFASPAAVTLLESGGETHLGRSLLAAFDAESRQAIVRQLDNLAAMPTGAVVPLEARIRTGGGQLLAVEGTACNLLGDTSIEGIVVTLRDVTARAELEEQLTRRALHDDLTGLPNRALFADRLAHALDSSAREPDLHVAVLFVDLDDFKAVNDGMGHGAGDELIRGVAARIRAGLRPGDTVARLGGDEFAVLVDRVPSLEYANDVAQRVLELLSLPIDVAGVSLAVPASVGITLAVQDSDVESLLRDADIAMYTAKSRGKSRIAIFDESLRDVATQRLALKIELPEALARGQFRLDYQPIQSVSDRGIVGFEALIRWHHPTRGIVPPGEFIPAAEQSGLIFEIGRWVLEEACRQAVVWNAAGERPLSMSVNVSAVQLHNPGFTDLLRNVLETAGLPPSLLTLELTESVLVDQERVVRILEELHTIGVKIAIDDFGTGYSSLSYLQKFPVTSVKVDRSFVAELTNGDPGLVRSIVSLAEALGLTTVAEGVETAGQLEALTALDCDLSQGFYIGYPQSADQIDTLLENPIHPKPRR